MELIASLRNAGSTTGKPKPMGVGELLNCGLLNQSSIRNVESNRSISDFLFV